MRADCKEHPHASMTEPACFSDIMIKVTKQSVTIIELSRFWLIGSAMISIEAYPHTVMPSDAVEETETYKVN